MNRFRFSEKLINQRKEVKMKNEDNVLVGLWFLTHDSEGNKEFQGQILSKLENNIYLVYLYDWLLGQASTMRLFPLDRLLNADFYSTEEDLKEDIRYHQS